MAHFAHGPLHTQRARLASKFHLELYHLLQQTAGCVLLLLLLLLRLLLLLLCSGSMRAAPFTIAWLQASSARKLSCTC